MQIKMKIFSRRKRSKAVYFRWEWSYIPKNIVFRRDHLIFILKELILHYKNELNTQKDVEFYVKSIDIIFAKIL